MSTELGKKETMPTPLKRLSFWLVSGAVVFGAIGVAKVIHERLDATHDDLQTTADMGTAAKLDASAYCYVATNLPNNAPTPTDSATPAPASNQIEVTAVVPVQYVSEPCGEPTY